MHESVIYRNLQNGTIVLLTLRSQWKTEKLRATAQFLHTCVIRNRDNSTTIKKKILKSMLSSYDAIKQQIRMAQTRGIFQGQATLTFRGPNDKSALSLGSLPYYNFSFTVANSCKSNAMCFCSFFFFFFRLPDFQYLLFNRKVTGVFN